MILLRKQKSNIESLKKSQTFFNALKSFSNVETGFYLNTKKNFKNNCVKKECFYQSSSSFISQLTNKESFFLTHGMFYSNKLKEKEWEKKKERLVQIKCFSLVKNCRGSSFLFTKNKNKKFSSKKINSSTKKLGQQTSITSSNKNISEKDLQKTSVFLNYCFDKGKLKNLITWFFNHCGEKATIQLVESLKDFGFQYATRSGSSIGLDDLKIPPTKPYLIFKTESQLEFTQNHYQLGMVTAVERFQHMIDLWQRTSETLKQEVVDYFRSTDLLNPVYMMAFSGARGNVSQVRQLVGMRGLMADPQGQLIEYPIRSNFREGMTLTEYIISCYGARKGLVDTALRTATSGYLTRRLVDVAQHIIISKFDCKTNRTILLSNLQEGTKTLLPLENRLVGRVLGETLNFKAGRNKQISTALALTLVKLKSQIMVRSPLTCKKTFSICQMCYGWSLAYSQLVPLGEAVGIIAAQSIGEPGTQLTMRTFHTGGVFSADLMDVLQSPYEGTVHFSQPVPGSMIRTAGGKIAFFTKKPGELLVKQESLPTNTGTGSHPRKEPTEKDLSNSEVNIKKYPLPSNTLLFVKQGEHVSKNQILVEFSSVSPATTTETPVEQETSSEMDGQVQLEINTRVKTKNTNNIFKKPSQSVLVKTSKNLIFFWVLFGKLYNSGSLIAKNGDLVDSATVFNVWNQTPNELGAGFAILSKRFSSLQLQRKNSIFLRKNTKKPFSVYKSIVELWNLREAKLENKRDFFTSALKSETFTKPSSENLVKGKNFFNLKTKIFSTKKQLRNWSFDKEYKTNQIQKNLPVKTQTSKSILVPKKNHGGRGLNLQQTSLVHQNKMFLREKNSSSSNSFSNFQKQLVPGKKLSLQTAKSGFLKVKDFHNSSLHELIELAFQHPIFTFQIETIHYYKCGYVLRPFLTKSFETKSEYLNLNVHQDQPRSFFSTLKNRNQSTLLQVLGENQKETNQVSVLPQIDKLLIGNSISQNCSLIKHNFSLIQFFSERSKTPTSGKVSLQKLFVNLQFNYGSVFWIPEENYQFRTKYSFVPSNIFTLNIDLLSRKKSPTSLRKTFVSRKTFWHTLNLKWLRRDLPFGYNVSRQGAKIPFFSKLEGWSYLASGTKLLSQKKSNIFNSQKKSNILNGFRKSFRKDFQFFIHYFKTNLKQNCFFNFEPTISVLLFKNLVKEIPKIKKQTKKFSFSILANPLLFYRHYSLKHQAQPTKNLVPVLFTKPLKTLIWYFQRNKTTSKLFFKFCYHLGIKNTLLKNRIHYVTQNNLLGSKRKLGGVSRKEKTCKNFWFLLGFPREPVELLGSLREPATELLGSLSFLNLQTQQSFPKTLDLNKSSKNKVSNLSSFSKNKKIQDNFVFLPKKKHSSYTGVRTYLEKKNTERFLFGSLFFLKNTKKLFSVFCNQMHIKKGWIYFPKNFKQAVKAHQKFYQVDTLSLDDLIFDQQMILVECLGFSTLKNDQNFDSIASSKKSRFLFKKQIFNKNKLCFDQSSQQHKLKLLKKTKSEQFSFLKSKTIFGSSKLKETLFEISKQIGSPRREEPAMELLGQANSIWSKNSTTQKTQTSFVFNKLTNKSHQNYICFNPGKLLKLNNFFTNFLQRIRALFAGRSDLFQIFTNTNSRWYVFNKIRNTDEKSSYDREIKTEYFQGTSLEYTLPKVLEDYKIFSFNWRKFTQKFSTDNKKNKKNILIQKKNQKIFLNKLCVFDSIIFFDSVCFLFLFKSNTVFSFAPKTQEIFNQTLFSNFNLLFEEKDQFFFLSFKKNGSLVFPFLRVLSNKNNFFKNKNKPNFFTIIRKSIEFSLVDIESYKENSLQQNPGELNLKNEDQVLNSLICPKQKKSFNDLQMYSNDDLQKSWWGIDLQFKPFLTLNLQTFSKWFYTKQRRFFGLNLSFKVPTHFPFKDLRLHFALAQNLYSRKSHYLKIGKVNSRLEFLEKSKDQITKKAQIREIFAFPTARLLSFQLNVKFLQKAPKIKSSQYIKFQTFFQNRSSIESIACESTPYEGEVLTSKKQGDKLLVSQFEHQSFSMSNHYQKNLLSSSENIQIGDFFRSGEEVFKNLVVMFSGQVIQIERSKITIRKGQPFVHTSQGVLQLKLGDVLSKNWPVMTFFYAKVKTEDIVQGIPKIEQLFEARPSIEVDSLKLEFKNVYHEYKQQYQREHALLKSYERISLLIVERIQKVYLSQGVVISDKHIEIIVKKVTSKVSFFDPQIPVTKLFPELISISTVLKKAQTSNQNQIPIEFLDSSLIQLTARDISKKSFQKKFNTKNPLLGKKYAQKHYQKPILIPYNNKITEIGRKKTFFQFPVLNYFSFIKNKSRDNKLPTNRNLIIKDFNKLAVSCFRRTHKSCKTKNWSFQKNIEYLPCLVGITKEALNSDSFLAAASFQETIRVLTRAVKSESIDFLLGIKERVILGERILAGTGDPSSLWLTSWLNYKFHRFVTELSFVVPKKFTTKLVKSILKDSIVKFKPKKVFWALVNSPWEKKKPLTRKFFPRFHTFKQVALSQSRASKEPKLLKKLEVTSILNLKYSNKFIKQFDSKKTRGYLFEPATELLGSPRKPATELLDSKNSKTLEKPLKKLKWLDLLSNSYKMKKNVLNL